MQLSQGDWYLSVYSFLLLSCLKLSSKVTPVNKHNHSSFVLFLPLKWHHVKKKCVSTMMELPVTLESSNFSFIWIYLFLKYFKLPPFMRKQFSISWSHFSLNCEQIRDLYFERSTVLFLNMIEIIEHWHVCLRYQFIDNNYIPEAVDLQKSTNPNVL